MSVPAQRPQVPTVFLEKLRAICLALPEAREQAAWVGTRWRIRQKTFAHALMLDAGWPPAYARAAKASGPLSLLTFRSPLPQLDAYAYTWEPFFRPPWFPDIVGMRLDAGTDWDELAGLLRDSYCHLAPQSLRGICPQGES